MECLNERAEPVRIEARGWYARILQHEINHLSGTVFVDRMCPRSFVSNYTRFWRDTPIEQARVTLCRIRDGTRELMANTDENR